MPQPSEHRDVHEVYDGHVYLHFIWQGAVHYVRRDDMIPVLRSTFAIGCDDHGWESWSCGQILN